MILPITVICYCLFLTPLKYCSVRGQSALMFSLFSRTSDVRIVNNIIASLCSITYYLVFSESKIVKYV